MRPYYERMVRDIMLTHKEIHEEFMRDPEYSAEYEALRPQYEVISEFIAARAKEGLSQEALAKRTGISRSNISRLESGNYNPSLQFMVRVAQGLGKQLHIELRDKTER
jgi:DNA-binding XRE family transcriptional regulator